MKVIIFAGGIGTRLWPLSRKSNPKQFEKIIGDQTMLQLAVNKLFPDFTYEDIFISTGKNYQETIKLQLPQIPDQNIIVEPQMRDVGPAVGLITALFVRKNPDEPIALLWGSDHLVKNEELFRKSLKAAEALVKKDPEKIIFLGQKPRFPSQNLGYIEFGEKIENAEGLPIYSFTGFQYRPPLEVAERFFKDGKHSWNLGYFVTTPRFLWSLFKQFSPELFAQLEGISSAYETEDFESTLNEIYPQIEKISFDNAILEKMDPKNGRVISVDMGWSDIGAWESLKEALCANEEDNATKGNVILDSCKDSLIFNYTNQTVVCIDTEQLLVVNTDDVVLVCPKNSVPKIKKLVESLSGTKNEHLT